MLEPGRRRTPWKQLWRAIRRFRLRIYSFDTAAAEGVARRLRVARTEGLGIHQIPRKMADLQTAGIAVAHKLQLATRNIADFEGLGLDLIDPSRTTNDERRLGGVAEPRSPRRGHALA
jgi:toxin FitB